MNTEILNETRRKNANALVENSEELQAFFNDKLFEDQSGWEYTSSGSETSPTTWQKIIYYRNEIGEETSQKLCVKVTFEPNSEIGNIETN
jgi:hypothetical protein